MTPLSPADGGGTAGAPEPRANPVFIGHAAAQQEFLQAWTGRRLHHAWLISGPRGIGKATLAYRMARFLLAQPVAAAGAMETDAGQGGLFGDAPPPPPPPPTLDMEPGHPIFRRIAQSTHGDLRVVERAYDDKRKRRRGEIVIDDVRKIGDFLSMTPTEGGWRVVIVDAADEMNRNSANALLKVLEEPPKRALLLLLAHNPARLLPTIRSRCRTLTLRPLPPADLEVLVRRYRPELDADDARALTLLGDGSIGRALDLAAQGGLVSYRQLIDLLRGLPRIDPAHLHAYLDKALRPEDGFRVTAELLLWWLARIIAAGARHAEPGEAVPGENGVLRTLLAAAPLDRWVEVWEKISHLVERAEAVNLDKKQVLLTAFVMVERAVRPAA